MPDNFQLMIPNATTNDGELEVFAPFDRSLIATAWTRSRIAETLGGSKLR